MIEADYVGRNEPNYIEPKFICTCHKCGVRIYERDTVYKIPIQHLRTNYYTFCQNCIAEFETVAE